MDAIKTWDGSPVNDYHTAIDREITFFLRTNNITQGQLAKRLKLTENTLSAKRKGKSEFKASELMQLAELMNMSLDQMCGLS